jgi:hypothetical protein
MKFIYCFEYDILQMEIIIAFLSQSTSPLNLNSLYIQWMNSLSNIVYDIQTMSTQSNK